MSFNCTLSIPGFEFNPETGKHVPVPFNFKEFFEGSASKNSTNKSSPKKLKAVAVNSKIVSVKPAPLPGWGVDPQTGKYVYVPYQIEDFLTFTGTTKAIPSSSSALKGSSSKRTSSFKSASKDEINQPNKYRKSVNGARKELFKTRDSEVKRNEKRNSLSNKGVRRSLLTVLPKPKRASKVSKMSVMSTISENQGSNLPVIIKKSTKDESPHFLRPNTSDDEMKTPDSVNSNNDSFLKLEQLCKTPKITADSPMGSVRKLFESKMTLDVRDEIMPTIVFDQVSDKTGIIAQLKEIVRLDRELCEDTSRKINEIIEQQARHVQHMTAIKALMDQLATDGKINDDGAENKENCPRRRSLRLQNNQPISSPIPLVPKDLRKSALTNSMARKGHKLINTPQRQKALDMYNSTRKMNSVLLTPRIFKNGPADEGDTITNLQQNLSIKVEQQCYMLQDTPAHK